MNSRDEFLIAILLELKWVVCGSEPTIRSQGDMRAIGEWIEKAVDHYLRDPEAFESAMLQALRDGTFTVDSVRDGELSFRLTEKGRALVDSMPHDLRRISDRGIS